MDEVEFWGKLDHPNVVKALNWYEDLSDKPHNKMYLMIQYADMGEVASGEYVGDELIYVRSKRIFDFVTNKLTNE